MKPYKHIIAKAFFLFLLFFFSCRNGTSEPIKMIESKQKVILDTDIDSDVDDAGALAMLLNMHKEGIIDLLGVIVTSDDPYAPVCVNVINTFLGYPAIPVGFLMGQPSLNNHSRYTKFLACEFPSKIKSWSDAEESTTLYRRLLTQSPDESVVVVTIGHLSSLHKLLYSSPDKISPLNGIELVNKKVNKWICMGGEFPQGKEANFYRPDPQSTVFCLDKWEKEAIFCGWEVGNKVITGGGNLKEKLNAKNPVYRAYELYNQFSGRPSWDQIAILQLTDKANTFFLYSDNGHCEVASDGSNIWRNGAPSNHKFVVIRPSVETKEIESYIESLILGLN